MMRMTRVIKYGFFGITTAALELASFLLLDQHVHIYIASTTSFFLGLIASFMFNKFFVFRNSRAISRVEVVRFAMLGIFNSQISSVITTGLFLLMPAVFAKAGTILFIAAWNYLIMSRIIFRAKGSL